MIHYWVLCGNLEKKIHLSITHSATPDTETAVPAKQCKENETDRRVAPRPAGLRPR